MNERERAERLAHDLDLRAGPAHPHPQAYTEQTAPEDRPLLALADRLSSHAPFAPTPAEQAQLRQRLEQIHKSRRNPTMQKSMAQMLKPAVHAALPAAVLLGVLTIAAVLLFNLLGKPAQPASGPAPATAATATPTQPAATLTPLPVSGPDRFEVKFQTVKDIDMELREVARVGSSLRVTLCYNPPSGRATRMDGLTLAVGDSLLPLYPSSPERPTAGPHGPACETFITEQPAASTDQPWKITLPRLVGPRGTMPDCAQVQQQLAEDYPNLSVECSAPGDPFGYTINHAPGEIDKIDDNEASRIVRLYMETEVFSGPWWFEVSPAEVITQPATGTPLDTVVVPAACDAHHSLFNDPRLGDFMHFHTSPLGFAGGGELQSGDFTFVLGLACAPDFSRLKMAGDGLSEVNGLGMLWSVTYTGEPGSGEVDHFSGVWPFSMSGGSTGSMNADTRLGGWEGLQFSENIRPDFSQSDARLRYLVRVRKADGVIEGAALAFTLQREAEGYHPVDVQVEPLSEEERQRIEGGPTSLEALSFPTLPAQATPTPPAENQALLDLLDGWQQPLLASPGWLHLRTRSEMPKGTDLYAGLTEYTNDDWYQIDERGDVLTHIHIDARPDGQVLQQSWSQDGKSVNLTFDYTADFQPFHLDLGYAVKDLLKPGLDLRRAEVIQNGKPVIVLALPGLFTRREAIDAASGAWLYSETVTLQEGEDPIHGGTLENRTTVEVVERVDAPPAEALALLGQDFAGYSPPPPHGTPAPQGLDPSNSPLTMQQVHGDDFNDPTFWYGDLYAEGYLLGRVDFGGHPGGQFCDRSPGGLKLAYNHYTTRPDGSVSDSSLRWFDLRDLSTIHQPAPELVNIGMLAWSPTEERLAVSACKADFQDCGLYLLDPAADQLTELLPDVYTLWPLLWSPDGSQIAMINTQGEDYPLYLVEAASGKVTYQGRFDPDAWQPPADSPTRAWGVDFPRNGYHTQCYEK